MANEYDVIGNVSDDNLLPIKDANVSDGRQSVKTNSDGYYELKTDKKTLTYTADGYATNTFDLGKYKLGAKVNADVTLKASTSKLKKGSFFEDNKKTIIYVGIGIVVLVGGFYVYKKFIKK